MTKRRVEDEILEELRAVRRDEAKTSADDPAWVARAAGRQTADEAAELAQRAAADDDARVMHALTAPRDDAFVDRLAERAAAAVRERAPEPETPAITAAPRRWTARRTFAVAAPALAMAAALAMWLRAAPADGLPPYAMSISGADQPSRATQPVDVGVPTFSPGAHVEVLAQPARAVAERLEARAFLVRDGETRPVGARAEVAPSGVVKIAGSHRELFGDATGRWDLVVVVAPPERVPATPADLDALVRAKPSPSASLVRTPVRIGAP